MGQPDMSNRPISRTLGLYVGAYVVFLYLPMTLIPIFSFNDSVQAAFPLKGFTLAGMKLSPPMNACMLRSAIRS